MSAIHSDYFVETPGITSRLSDVDPTTRREIQRSLSKRVHGVFASPKNRKPIPWRNRDEQALFGLLEIDPAVRSFEAMPEKVTFLLNGKEIVHVPSVRVMTTKGMAILDVARSGGRLAGAMAVIYAGRGIAYRAVGTRSLHVLPRRSNAEWILTFRGFEPTPTAVLRVTKALSNRDGLSVGTLSQSLHIVEPHATVCAMALDGRLSLDLTAAHPLEMRATPVRGSRPMSTSFRFNVPVGQYADLDGKLAKYLGRARDKERRIIFEDMDGVPTHMTDSELLALQHGGGAPGPSSDEFGGRRAHRGGREAVDQSRRQR